MLSCLIEQFHWWFTDVRADDVTNVRFIDAIDASASRDGVRQQQSRNSTLPSSGVHRSYESAESSSSSPSSSSPSCGELWSITTELLVRWFTNHDKSQSNDGISSTVGLHDVNEPTRHVDRTNESSQPTTTIHVDTNDSTLFVTT